MTQLIIIGCYLGLLLLLGVFSSRLFKGTSKDYMLASHSIGPFLLLMSIFGTTMTAFALVGSTGEAFKEGVGVYGLLASSSGIIHSLCFFILGIRLWTLGSKYGYTTQIQFFRDRLQSDRIGLLLFPILVGLVIPYLLIGVMASGSVINSMTSGKPTPAGVVGGAFEQGVFPEALEMGQDAKSGKMTFAAGSGGGLPKQLASLIVCGVVLVYVFFGGMRGTAWANTFQTIVFMILGCVTFYMIAMKLGGQETLMESLRAASAKIPKEKLVRGVVGSHEGMSKLKFFTYMFVPLSVGMFPHLFQHWLTAKSANSFKLPVVAHPIFIMIVWVPCVLIGAWASSDLFFGTLPPPLQAKLAGNANIVLPMMVKKLVSPMFGGFLTAGILAAIMSSLDSQFLCIGTMFTEDIVKHYAPKGSIDDKKSILIARAFIIGIVLVTYTLSLFEPKSVFTLGVWCFSGFASLFPLIFACLYWRKLTRAGAYACVIAAFGSWFFLFRQSGYASNTKYVLHIPGTEYEIMPVAAMFVCSALAMIVVSLATKPPEEEHLKRFFG